jgi:hypothetical protein
MLPYPNNLLDQSFGDKMHRFKANFNNKANWQQIHEIWHALRPSTIEEKQGNIQ